MSRARENADGARLDAPLAGPTFSGVTTAASLVLTPGSAPATTTGAVYYNSTSETVYVYNGIAWVPLTDSPTGGTITSYTSGGTTYMVHTFTSSGTFTTGATVSVDWLVVAGGGAGGGGGARGGGGGGAGGFRTGASHSITAQTYTITVGAGGAYGSNGGNSVFSTITSTGGGKGGDEAGDNAGDGGSGGGGAGSSTIDGGDKVAITPITGEVTTVQGFDGGNGVNGSGYLGGGGGGAGAVGVTPGSHGGNGGVGVDQVMNLSEIDSYTLSTNANAGHETGDGTAAGSKIYRYFAGGGGGARGTANNNGVGGLGGGGFAHSMGNTTFAGNGTANTGGGGGGHGYGGSANVGRGGSGIVIIRYAI